MIKSFRQSIFSLKYLEKLTPGLRLSMIFLLLSTIQVCAASYSSDNITVSEQKEDALTSQQNRVSGIVTGKDRAPLPGVNVVVTGTTQGTITDSEGKYSIDLPQGARSLTFSFIGMEPQEISIGTLAQINVTMVESAFGLDEVVVVGYGTQKKVNLTGSISTVRSDEIIGVPTQTISQALMGKASGFFIKNVNSQPGDFNKGVVYNIRGFGTPLIIVDGVPATNQEFNQLDPNDIEEFNVLKDATSAAVFGARAGNGVILVKTKRGELSDAVVTITSNYGLQFFTAVPDFVSSAQYFEMENLAYFNAGKPAKWTDEQIKIARDGTDPINYPNTNWWNAVFRKYAPQSQHNINISGGNEKVKYFISGGYFHRMGC